MIQKLEDLVRASKFKEVEALLNSISWRKLAREELFHYANIARRIHNFRLALAILNPIVRSDKQSIRATDAEKIEYAESLRRLGAISEAQQMLNEVDRDTHPDVALIQAFCFFSQWEYEQALPLLEFCASNEKLPVYRRVVSQLNWAAALVNLERFDEAMPHLERLREVTKENAYGLLHGNVLEITSQCSIARGAWSDAETLLSQAENVLGGAHTDIKSLDALFVQKWKSIMACLRSKDGLSLLQVVRARALQIAHWETLRECDLYLGCLGGSHQLFTQVYFGTPYAAYRKKALRLAERHLPRFVLPKSFSLTTSPALSWGGSGQRAPFVEAPGGAAAAAASNSLIVEKAQLFSSQNQSLAGLTEGQVSHRLLIALSRDFYRPVPLLALFGSLFPDEFYNPESSPNRIHQAIKKMRRWLLASGCEIQLQELDGTYRLIPTSATSIVVPQKALPLDADKLQMARLLRVLNECGDISARELANRLDVSLASSKRLLLRAKQSGLVRSIGQGPKSRYAIAC